MKSIFKSNENISDAAVAEPLAPVDVIPAEAPVTAAETAPLSPQTITAPQTAEESTPEIDAADADKVKPPTPRKFGPISPSEIIAVVNQKGGCGKTTTAINLGASLAKKGQRVLLIDLDPQAHATLGLGIKVAEGVKTIYEVLMEQTTPAAEAIHPTKLEKFHIIPGNTRLSSAQIDLLSWEGREQVLKSKLLPCLSAYQCIIIDCPPSLSMLTINALVAAHRMIVPIQTHYFALDGMKQLFATVDQTRSHFNSSLSVLGILTTMVDPRTNICKDMIAAIRDYFKNEVFISSIKMNVKLIECSLYGEPVITYAPYSIGALSYLELADEVLERLRAPVFQTAA